MATSTCENISECGKITMNNKSATINYLSNIASTKKENMFTLPWNNSVILRECDIVGNLIDLRQTKENMKKSRLNPWANLTFKPFIDQDNDRIFPVFVCSICPSMQGVLSLGKRQNEHELNHKLCYHSKIVCTLIRDWKTKFNVSENIDEIKESYITDAPNDAIILKEKIGSTTKTQWLVGVFNEKEVSILFTVGKQSTPTCTKCSSRKCTCFWLFKKHLKDIEEQTNNNDTSIPTNTNIESNESNINIEPNISSQTTTNTQTNTESSVEPPQPSTHYKDPIGEIYGHNKKPIYFPFKRCPEQMKMSEEKESQSFTYPSILAPLYDKDRLCSHGFQYNEDDSLMGICAQSIVIYTENSEKIHPTIVKYRRSVGPCSCQHQFDGHELLLWHLGNGRMVDYKLLHNYFNDWIRTGIPIKAKHSSIISNAISMGRTSTLSYDMLLRAIDGFVNNLSFDIQKCFICPRCGRTPRYFIGDGTKTGPLKTKIKAANVKELGNHKDDIESLTQGSKYSNRVFISKKSERDEILKLLSGNIDMSEFIETSVIKSENGKLIQKMVVFILETHGPNLPEEYKSFLCDVSKSSSVAGLMQVRREKPLTILRKICNMQLDITNATNISKLDLLNRELPALWPQLIKIIKLEKYNFLPKPVADVVLCLISIRRATFEQCPQRFQEDYYPYEQAGIYKEHESMFYPVHPLIRYPKSYVVSGTTDEDFCKKTFPEKGSFIPGIFNIGCCCDLMITYGE